LDEILEILREEERDLQKKEKQQGNSSGQETVYIVHQLRVHIRRSLRRNVSYAEKRII